MSLGHGASKTVRDGIVLHLDAANPKSYSGSGTDWLDMSGHNNHASLKNSPTFVSDQGGYIRMDGTDDHAEVLNSSELNSENMTLIVWLRGLSTTWDDTGYFISKRDVYVMHPNAGATSVSFYFRLNGNWRSRGGDIAVAFGPITEWRMYAQTWDGNTLACYVDGQLFTSTTSFSGETLNTSDTGVIHIGRDDSIGRYGNADISVAEQYNRALSASEIEQNFNALRGRYGV